MIDEQAFGDRSRHAEDSAVAILRFVESDLTDNAARSIQLHRSDPKAMVDEEVD
jgi:hypothetical protein